MHSSHSCLSLYTVKWHVFRIQSTRTLRDHVDPPATCAALDLYLNTRNSILQSSGIFSWRLHVSGFKTGLSALIISLEVTRAAFHEHQLLVLFSNEGCDCVTENFRVVQIVLAGGHMYWDSKLVSRRWFVP